MRHEQFQGKTSEEVEDEGWCPICPFLGRGIRRLWQNQPSTASTHTRHVCHHTGESGGWGRISPPRFPSIPVTCAITQALVLSSSQSSQHYYLNGGEETHTAKGVLDAEVRSGLLRVSVPDTHRRKEISWDPRTDRHVRREPEGCPLGKQIETAILSHGRALSEEAMWRIRGLSRQD